MPLKSWTRIFDVFGFAFLLETHSGPELRSKRELIENFIARIIREEKLREPEVRKLIEIAYDRLMPVK